MPIIDIWVEGWAATGGRGEARNLGQYEAENFDEAVQKYMEDHPDHTIEKDARGYTDWACRLYDNEEDARKNFG